MRKLQPLFRVETKHHSGDCAVACLAALLQQPYPEVLVVASKVQPLVLVEGLDNDDIIKIAALFGKVLEECSESDIDYKRATGILGMKTCLNHEEDEHAVVLSNGLVFDPEDGGVWHVREYLKKFKATNIDLLELEE